MGYPMKPARQRYFVRFVLPVAVLVGGVAIAGVVVGLWMGAHMARAGGPQRGFSSGPAIAGEGREKNVAKSFVVLRIPDVFASAHKQPLAAKRLDDWLSAMKKADFQPMLLSDVLAASRREEGLPDKAVILMVQPGYRETRDVLGPIFAKHNCPVLWVTDRRAVERGDHRYISRVDALEMRFGGMADIGYFDEKSVSSFDLEPAMQNREVGKQRIFLGSGVRDGRTAVNAEDDLKTLNRLNVNLQWSGAEMVQRVMSEMPLNERTRLTVVNMAGHMLGVAATPLMPELLLRFDLRAPPGSRSTSIRWDSTMGSRDMEMELEAQAISGELWTYLRYDRKTGSGVMVGLTPTEVIIRQSDKGMPHRIAAFPWSPPAAGPITVKLAVVEDRLGMSITGMPDRAVNLPSAQASAQSSLGLMVSDRISGVAQARGVLLYVTPLGRGFNPLHP